jgi:Uma2 family endonuclease
MQATIATPLVSMDAPPPRKKFTRGQVDQMLEAGFFAGERYELINGDLIDKMGQNPPHAHAIRLLNALLTKIFGGERVQVQLPVEVSIADRELSIPEPDLAVLKKADPRYAGQHPRCDELTLIVEVADTTVRHDSTTKRDLYARAGAPEYWLLNVPARKLFVYRKLVEAEYRELTILAEGDFVNLEIDPPSQLPIAGMLP